MAAAVAGALVLLGMLLPSRAEVVRSISIDAPPATVFALLNDFGWVREWTDRFDDDPNVRTDFGGPPRGVDASMAWNGAIVGTGQETITSSTAPAVVETRIDRSGPAADTSRFELAVEGVGTRLTWTHTRHYGFNLPGRIYGLLYRRMAGRSMDTGLERLAAIADTLPQADFSGLEVERFFEQGSEIAWRRATSFPAASSISEAMSDAFYDILNFIDRHGLQEAGAPMSISREFADGQLVFDAAIPVRNIADDTPAQEGSVSLGATYEGPVVRVKHIGSYATLADTHERIVAYLAAMRLTRNGDAWESYVSDPTKTPEDDLVTYVYYPVEGE